MFGAGGFDVPRSGPIRSGEERLTAVVGDDKNLGPHWSDNVDGQSWNKLGRHGAIVPATYMMGADHRSQRPPMNAPTAAIVTTGYDACAPVFP